MHSGENEFYIKSTQIQFDILNTSNIRLRKQSVYRKMEKKLMEKTFRPWAKWYTSSKRKFRYEDINIIVNPGVFHPGLFFSTKILLEFISNRELKDKKVLELGAGTGLISIYAASQGAQVTASDINLTAVRNIQENIETNKDRINLNNGCVGVIHSDLFEAFSDCKFDLILINPPFFRGEVTSPSQHAWYCGKDLDFFSSLFKGIKPHLHSSTEVYLILSQDAEIDEIRKLADENKYHFELVSQKKNFFETNYVFKVVLFPGSKGSKEAKT